MDQDSKNITRSAIKLVSVLAATLLGLFACVDVDSESKQVVREVDVGGTRFKIDAHATMLDIEDDEVLALLVGLVRVHGYRCDTVNAAYPSPFGGGVTVICHDYAYKYLVEDRGGKWSVTLD